MLLMYVCVCAGYMAMPQMGSSVGIAVPRQAVDCGPYSSTYPPGAQFQTPNPMYPPSTPYNSDMFG